MTVLSNVSFSWRSLNNNVLHKFMFTQSQLLTYSLPVWHPLPNVPTHWEWCPRCASRDCHGVDLWCCWCNVQRMLTGHEAVTYNQSLMKLETAFTELEVCFCWVLMQNWTLLYLVTKRQVKHDSQLVHTHTTPIAGSYTTHLAAHGWQLYLFLVDVLMKVAECVGCDVQTDTVTGLCVM